MSKWGRGIYQRGSKLWGRVKGSDGKWRSVPLDVRAEAPDAGRKAKRRLDGLQRKADRKRAGGATGATTIAAYGERWLKSRKGRVTSWRGEDSHLRHHVIPALGSMKLEDVRPRHVRDWIYKLRQESSLSPRSIHQAYGVLSRMMKSAQIEELIEASPVIVDKGVLPKKADKDPTWRAGALFTRAELELLISDDRIPHERRVLYALLGLAGLRPGEAPRLRWRDLERGVEPLGRLYVWRTKTEAPRAVPVHPVLAAILAEWKLATGGEAADLILPKATNEHRARARRLDLAALGLRPRRSHDLRRTMISLARQDGARADILERVTHSGRSAVFEMYSSYDWPTLCGEVAKLKVERRAGGEVVPLATALLQGPERADMTRENCHSLKTE